MRTLIRGAQVLTLDPGRPLIPDGAVLVEGDRIVGVDTYAALRQSPGIEQEWGSDDTGGCRDSSTPITTTTGCSRWGCRMRLSSSGCCGGLGLKPRRRRSRRSSFT